MMSGLLWWSFEADLSPKNNQFQLYLVLNGENIADSYLEQNELTFVAEAKMDLIGDFREQAARLAFLPWSGGYYKHLQDARRWSTLATGLACDNVIKQSRAK